MNIQLDDTKLLSLYGGEAASDHDHGLKVGQSKTNLVRGLSQLGIKVGIPKI